MCNTLLRAVNGAVLNGGFLIGIGMPFGAGPLWLVRVAGLIGGFSVLVALIGGKCAPAAILRDAAAATNVMSAIAISTPSATTGNANNSARRCNP